MSKIIPYVLLIVAIAVIWFLAKGCGHKPGPDNSLNKAFVDSITQKAAKDSVEAKKVVASISDSLAYFRRSNDSLHNLQKRSESIVNKAGGRILALNSRIDSLKRIGDVAGQLKGCDSLRKEVENAAKIVSGYEYVSDSLIDRLKAERKQADSVKNYLWGMFSSTNSDLFEISRKYHNLDANYGKLNVKPKRWGIGPGVGAVITSNGVKPGISVSLHYDFIRF
jgi:hypothetical protein